MRGLFPARDRNKWRERCIMVPADVRSNVIFCDASIFFDLRQCGRMDGLFYSVLHSFGFLLTFLEK